MAKQKFNIGQQSFDIKDTKAGLSFGKPVYNQTRWASFVNTTSLTSLGTITSLMAFNVITNSRLIRIKNLIVNCIFTDTGIGDYKVNNFTVYVPSDNVIGVTYNVGNSVLFFDANNQRIPTDLVMMIDPNLGYVPIQFSLSGGSVLRETGITPAVGDTVAIYGSLQYIPEQ